MGSAMPHRRSYLRLFSWVAAAALLVAGLAAIQPARSAAAARSGPLAHPVLTASHAPLAMLASAPSVPVGTGPVRGGTFLTFSLTDRLQALVNVGSGNLLVRSTDLVLPGIEGSVALGADYNSLLIGSSKETGAFGHGWRSRSGIDVRLIANSDGTVTFTGADGVVGTFTPITGTSNYTSPGVFKATLVKTSSGWNLTDHGCGCVTAFKSSGKPSTITDRNGNVTTVNYNSSGQQTKITYDSAGNLTSITDPDGNQYIFGYDSSHNLTSITTPTTPGGVAEQTMITYDSSHRVTSLTRFIGPKSTDLATTRLSYVSSTETQVADANTDQSQPVANVPHTTYTLDAQKRVTKVTDPAGNSRSTSYTPFNDVATFTNAVGGKFTNMYPSSVNGGESLTNVASPMGASVSFAYANPPTASNPTANFQPSSSSDAQGNPTAYTYNGAGNLASAKDALAAVASVGYNSDGTVNSATDPMNGTNSTTYGYNSDHQLPAHREQPRDPALHLRRVRADRHRDRRRRARHHLRLRRRQPGHLGVLQRRHHGRHLHL